MLDPKEEQKFEQLRKLAQELHIPMPEHFIELEVFDKDGKSIQKHKQRSHSWVRNAYNHLLSQMAGVNINDATFEAGKLSIKKTDATILTQSRQVLMYDATTSMEAVGYGYFAGAGINTFGIQVGSGVNAESFEDFVLQTLIAEGAGAGQLNYAASEAISESYNAGTKVYTITRIRYLNNNSAGNVNVNEVSLVANVQLTNTDYALHSRDKLGATVTVPATGQLKVTYTIQLTYPA